MALSDPIFLTELVDLTQFKITLTAIRLQPVQRALTIPAHITYICVS